MEVAEIWIVLAVCGAACLLVWQLRRRGLAQGPRFLSRAGRTLASVERLALTSQHSLHLLRVHDQAILIAASPAGCQVIRSFDWPEVQAAKERVA